MPKGSNFGQGQKRGQREEIPYRLRSPLKRGLTLSGQPLFKGIMMPSKGSDPFFNRRFGEPSTGRGNLRESMNLPLTGVSAVPETDCFIST